MATTHTSITEAKRRLESLLADAEVGHEVIITRWGKPVVRLEAVRPTFLNPGQTGEPRNTLTDTPD